MEEVDGNFHASSSVEVRVDRVIYIYIYYINIYTIYFEIFDLPVQY